MGQSYNPSLRPNGALSSSQALAEGAGGRKDAEEPWPLACRWPGGAFCIRSCRCRLALSRSALVLLKYSSPVTTKRAYQQAPWAASNGSKYYRGPIF